ncbi:UDP-GlcNAc:betaGal beta-1,3-N-acetylglucosaminyltransferase 9 [Echinococcus granulosus]|nr:UDP-GlcNAc:betaGal beta-1,3-N-acetylglucosaminyltransferase 9 [Echinococcus granulosus]
MRIRYFKLAPYTFYTLFTLLTVGLLLHILPLRPRMRPIVWFTRTQPAPTPSAQIVWPMKLGNSRQPYELQLDAIISSDSAVANLATVESNLVLGRNASSTTLTYADLVKIPDDHWLRPHHPNVYFAYPQAFNLTQIYDNLLQQKPIPQLPVNGYMFRYLVISRDVCHPDNPASQMLDLVVVVRSSVANFKRRQEFRKLYSPFTNRSANINTHLRIGLVFSMGVPRSQQNNLFMRGGKVLSLTSSGGAQLNAEGLRATAASFEAERAKYNDLVVGDYEDTYYNLTTKTIYSFQWAAAFCRNSRPTLLFIDDDLPISMTKFANTISKLPPETRANLYHGKVLFNITVRRFVPRGFNKWSVEKQEVPWTVYPTYTCGAFLLLGFPQLERLAIGMLFTQAFPLEDAYTGVVAARMGLRPGSMYDLVRPEHILTKRPHNLESVEHFLSKI